MELSTSIEGLTTSIRVPSIPTVGSTEMRYEGLSTGTGCAYPSAGSCPTAVDGLSVGAVAAIPVSVPEEGTEVVVVVLGAEVTVDGADVDGADVEAGRHCE